MFSPSFVFLALVLGSTYAQAFTLSLNKIEGRTGAYLKGLPDADRARASLHKKRGSSKATTIPATNLDYVQYTASIGVGSPATYYNLVVDTGSSNTFVGTGKKYVRTNTSQVTDQKVNVTYGSGFFTGKEYIDQVTISDNFIIKNQSIGDALKFAQFEGVDGIIGVGPVALTQGTLMPNVNGTIPTVLDNALQQGLISTEVLGVSFAPATSNVSINGALSFGGADSSLYTGDITYTPITITFPSNFYWGVNITQATYGNTKVIADSYAGIVDTGTTQILLADDFFAKYKSAIPGSSVDKETGLFEIPKSSVADIKPFNFTIGGTVYSLDAGAQLIPEDQNTVWGGKAGVQYGYFGPLGSPSGEGLDFIIGQKFIERYYAIFDTTNQRVGFAFTNHTFTSS